MDPRHGGAAGSYFRQEQSSGEMASLGLKEAEPLRAELQERSFVGSDLAAETPVIHDVVRISTV